MFLPENIDLAYSEKYNLSIRLTPNGFSFCIYSPTDPSVFNYQETALSTSLSAIENIKKLIFDFGFFSQNYNETSVTIVSPDFTLVPEQYYDGSKIKDLYSFNIHDYKGVVISDYISKCKAYLLFSMDDVLHSFLTRHLSNPVFHHHITLLTDLYQSYNIVSDRNRCFVDFQDSSISVICFSGSQLLSANSFDITASNDASYYIFNVWDKLNLDQSRDYIFISGKAESYKQVISSIKKLIKHVERVNLDPVTVMTEDQIKTVPTDLMARLCE